MQETADENSMAFKHGLINSPAGFFPATSFCGKKIFSVKLLMNDITLYCGLRRAKQWLGFF
jgi:hypothetical protein